VTLSARFSDVDRLEMKLRKFELSYVGLCRCSDELDGASCEDRRGIVGGTFVAAALSSRAICSAIRLRFRNLDIM
jgi:hypothetical protein